MKSIHNDKYREQKLARIGPFKRSISFNINDNLYLMLFSL